MDLACGTSPFRRYFPRAQAYIRVDKVPADSGVISGDMLSIPLAEKSVDTVLLFQAISDVRAPLNVLKEVERVLRPEGCVIVFESMAYPEHDLPLDFYRIMPEGLRDLAEQAGLRMVECTRLGGLFTRFGSLWNTFVMGRLGQIIVFRPIAYIGIMAANVVCYGLDSISPHRRLASDYLAVLTLSRQLPEEIY